MFYYNRCTTRPENIARDARGYKEVGLHETPDIPARCSTWDVGVIQTLGYIKKLFLQMRVMWYAGVKCRYNDTLMFGVPTRSGKPEQGAHMHICGAE